jgi:hypothetical protein
MPEFIQPGRIGRQALGISEESRARRIWERATIAARLASPQPFSTLAPSLPTGAVLAYVLTRAGMPPAQAARFLRVSVLGVAALTAQARHARRDPPVADWLDALAAAMPSFHDIGEAA